MRVLQRGKLSLEIEGQPRAEAADPAAAVAVVIIDKLSVSDVVVEIESGIRIEQPVDAKGYAIENTAVDLAVAEAKVVVTGPYLPSTLADDRSAILSARANDIKIVTGNWTIKTRFDQRIRPAFSREEIEHLGIATLIKDGADFCSSRRLLAGCAFPAFSSCDTVVKPRTKILRLERPRPIIAHKL